MTIDIHRVAGRLRESGLLVEERGTLPPTAATISDDSRAVTPGTVFVAVKGSARDGHDFLDAAAQQGAVAAIVEDGSRTNLPALVVRQGRRAAAIAAAAAYGDPARSLTLAAVTGTNGKTTTVGLLRHLLDEGGAEGDATGGGGPAAARAASIGTLGVLIGSDGDAL